MLPLYSILESSEVRQAMKANFKERIIRINFLEPIVPVMPLMEVYALVLKDHPLNCLDESVSFNFIFFVYLHLAPPFFKGFFKWYLTPVYLSQTSALRLSNSTLKALSIFIKSSSFISFISFILSSIDVRGLPPSIRKPPECLPWLKGYLSGCLPATYRALKVQVLL